MIDLIIGFAVAGVLLITEYILCTKLKNPLWGGIIPMLILIGTIFIFVSEKIPFTTKNMFPFVVVNTLFFGDWGTGRDKYKKLQQAEINKMKAKDI
ncbi:hypothetical protein AALB52_17865 [Lachnospiraceae bacterium 38-14]